jgi:hypothetical protein
LPKPDFSCPYHKNQVTKSDSPFCAATWTMRQKGGLVSGMLEFEIRKIRIRKVNVPLDKSCVGAASTKNATCQI